MKDVITTELGRKWWFSVLVGGLGAMLTLPVLRAAGLDSPEGWAQWLVCFLCFASVWRFLSFAGWLAVLLLKPGSKLLDPARR